MLCICIIFSLLGSICWLLHPQRQSLSCELAFIPLCINSQIQILVAVKQGAIVLRGKERNS